MPRTGKAPGESTRSKNATQNSAELFAERLKQKRNELGWSQAETADTVELNLRSYQYWERAENLDWVDRLAKVAEKMGVSVAYFFNQKWLPLLPLRNAEEIVGREECCSDFWVMKTGKKFMAENPSIREKMLNFMLNNKVNFHFVFAAPSSGLPGDACASFELFCGEVEKHKSATALRKHIEGRSIPDEATAFKLGLSDHWMTFVLAQYNAEGRKKFKRPIDVWIEFAREATASSGGRAQEYLWVELDLDEARSWHQRREPILKSLPIYQAHQP